MVGKVTNRHRTDVVTKGKGRKCVSYPLLNDLVSIINLIRRSVISSGYKGDEYEMVKCG